MAGFPWGDESLALLSARWSEGVTVVPIARELTERYGVTCSKNAVIGKAHRLGLPSRPSPIKTAGTVAKPKATMTTHKHDTRPVKPVVTLPALPSIPTHKPVFTAPVRPVQTALVLPFPSARKCEWLSGDVKPYTRCNHAAVPPGPGVRPPYSYCQHHRVLAFIKSPSKVAS